MTGRPGDLNAADEPTARRATLRRRLELTLLRRVSPERTRRATLTERLTVSRMSWERLVLLNRVLEISGKIATGVWIAAIAAIVLGFDLQDYLERAMNSGRPVEGLLAVAILLPTVIFLLLRSAIGYGRWRVQRELWRRDVARLTELAREAGAAAD